MRVTTGGGHEIVNPISQSQIIMGPTILTLILERKKISK